jgi:hypothetical protein
MGTLDAVVVKDFGLNVTKPANGCSYTVDGLLMGRFDKHAGGGGANQGDSLYGQHLVLPVVRHSSFESSLDG